jgi:CheY-like chemotaxis protein
MSLKILVVDDEPDALKLMKAVLEPLGHQVLALVDSREAASRVNEQKFDVAFVDVRMPEVDGFELTRRIRNSAPNSSIAVVMLTGAYDVEVIRKASQEGVSFFLTKPFNTERLSRLLHAMDHAMWKETRRYARLPLETTVNCKSGEKQFELGSLNIGEGGMLLEHKGSLKVGQDVRLEFTVQEIAKLLTLRAKVVRRGRGHVAVEFVDLMPEDRKAIKRYVTGQSK